MHRLLGPGSLCTLQCRRSHQGCTDTFGRLALPDEEGAMRVARCQQLPLCVLAADVFEEPPEDKGAG